ncbi:GD22059 [Drosophila simulans]|uniref:GD22059 n=1 Tax=Drosophila simulans TaxID=7240 RepID=B4Q4T7_DROSI|nr:GD22059 [Drosophila simulans]
MKCIAIVSTICLLAAFVAADKEDKMLGSSYGGGYGKPAAAPAPSYSAPAAAPQATPPQLLHPTPPLRFRSRLLPAPRTTCSAASPTWPQCHAAPQLPAMDPPVPTRSTPPSTLLSPSSGKLVYRLH